MHCPGKHRWIDDGLMDGQGMGALNHFCLVSVPLSIIIFLGSRWEMTFSGRLVDWNHKVDSGGRKETIYSVRLHRVPLPHDQDPELFAMYGSRNDCNSIWSSSINGMRQPSVDGFSHASQVDDICLIDARQQQSATNEGCNKINIVIYSCLPQIENRDFPKTSSHGDLITGW